VLYRWLAVIEPTTLFSMRSLSPVEAAAAVAIAGSVLATAVPAFVRNLHASRLSEASDGLERIAMRAAALAAGRSADSAYPDTAPLTPAQVPRGERVTDPPGTWDHATWRRLDFELTVPHSFSFEFLSVNGLSSADAGNDGKGASPSADAAPAQPGRARFTARAHGDLDGDGSYSTFEISGESSDGAEPVTFPMTVDRAVE
jgi:hypothetical protein